MPIIQVDGPKVADVSRKREFVRAVTEAASGFYGLPREKIIILLKENSPDNISVGGQLLCDRPVAEKKP